MSSCVIDASVAVKWVVEESGTAEALAVRSWYRLIAPDLLAAECANILRKKVQRKELLLNEALLAARLLQSAEIELLPSRSHMEEATRMAVDLDHPVYDCLYLALAAEQQCPFVTADERLVKKIREKHGSAGDLVLTLREAGTEPKRESAR